MNGPQLSGERLTRAFPFHLWLDGQLRLLAAGPSLTKALPALQPGAVLHECFELRRPRGATTLEDWRAHGSDLCTLRSRAEPALTLRGSCEVMDDGTVLLLVSPVFNALDELRAHGLGFNDFARHDAVGEMLLMARSMQTSLADTERLAARLKLRSQQLDAILELSVNGVVLFDAAGRLLHGNGAMLRMLGLRREQLPGMTAEDLDAQVEQLVEPELRGQHWFSSSAGAATRTLRLAAPRRSVVELREQASADGARAYYLRDMTAEFEVDRMKSEFLSTAAHELRTPMVSVFGFTELLLNRPVDEQRRRDVLQTIHRQCSRLIHMVNELLDLARIEARQGQTLARAALPLATLVQEAVRAVHLGAGEHEVVYEPRFEAATALLDRDKTMQALANVLSNAVKYSPDGGTIRVSLHAGHHRGNRALGVRIADPGIGMTPEQSARVFERFYRADPSGNIPGTGLGMSLVKEIVELQGGRVDVVSQPGQGTRVTLWFPLLDSLPAAGPSRGGLREGRCNNEPLTTRRALLGPQSPSVTVPAPAPAAA